MWSRDPVLQRAHSSYIISTTKNHASDNHIILERLHQEAFLII